MKAFYNIVCLLLVVFLEFVINHSFAQAQTTTKVIVSPSSMKIQPLRPVAIDIKGDGFDNLFAASVTVAFDSTVLRYLSIINGSFLTRNNANSVFLGIVQHPPPPAAPNIITVDQAICGGGTVSGSGTLFTLLFVAIRAGMSPVNIVSYEFRNGSNKYISVQTDSGIIIVNSTPKTVQLVSPKNGDVIDTTLPVSLVWSKSIDNDTGDNVRYMVHLTSAFSSFTFSNISDTTLPLTKGILKEDTEFMWYVDATDGIDTAFSMQTFKFKTPGTHYLAEIPDVLNVEQNYPNPFNQFTTIQFSVNFATQAEVKVYDMTGREIIRLMSCGVIAGNYKTIWNGRTSTGVVMGSGIYIYEVTAGTHRDVKKMVLLK